MPAIRCVTGHDSVPKLSVPTFHPAVNTMTIAPATMSRNAFDAAISRQPRAATAIVCRTRAAKSKERRAGEAGAASIGASRSGAVSTTTRRRHQRRSATPPWYAKRKRASSSAKATAAMPIHSARFRSITVGHPMSRELCSAGVQSFVVSEIAPPPKGSSSASSVALPSAVVNSAARAPSRNSATPPR